MTRLPELGRRGGGWVALQVILLAAIGLAGFGWRGAWTGPLAVMAGLGGVLLLVAGALLLGVGVRALGSSLTALPSPREGAALVETGIYARVRHPIYGGLILGAVGFALLMASPVALLLALVLAAFFVLKSRREEAWLAERFPGYPAYSARTRRFIPGLF